MLVMFFSLLSLNYDSEISDHISEVSEQASQASKVSQQTTESIEETSLSCNAASENCDSASAISMSFASFEDEQLFESLKNLIFRINEQVESRDYVVVLDRIKKSKLDVRRKAWLICDRDRKINESRDQNRRHIANRRIECSFFVVVIRDVDSDAWFLKIVNERHNHSATFVEAHSVHRK